MPRITTGAGVRHDDFAAVIFGLVRARKDQGVSMQRLADRAGVTKLTVRRIESGQHDVFGDTLARVADALGYRLVLVAKEEQ